MPDYITITSDSESFGFVVFENLSSASRTPIVWGTQTNGAAYAPGATLNVSSKGLASITIMQNGAPITGQADQPMTLADNDTTGTRIFYLAADGIPAGTYQAELVIDCRNSTTLPATQRQRKTLYYSMTVNRKQRTS